MEAPKISSHNSLRKFLKENPSVEFIRCQYLDIGNIVRCMIMTRQYADSLGGKPHKLSPSSFALLPNGDFDLASFHPVGYNEMWPDWDSVRLCTYAGDGKTHVTVMCYIKECQKSFVAWGRDPRTVLYRALARAKAEYDLEFLVGFEVEFVLENHPNSKDKIEIPEATCESAAAFRDDRLTAVLEEIMRALQRAGINVTYFHQEAGGRGHFEIPLGPLAPMASVESLVFAKETIYTIAKRHGLIATCFPKPRVTPESKEGADICANGAHFHFSINDGRDEQANHFLAGILHLLPALCAFSMPNFDSYCRLGTFRGTTGSDVGWGVENKDYAVRKIANRETYWGFRCADQTANMFLTLAAWITAGCYGLSKNKPLKWKDADGLTTLITTDELIALG